MAPLPPSKPSARALRHQRITGQIHPLLPSKIFRPQASTNDAFLTSKSDRRLMKHSSFLSRVISSANTPTTASSPGGGRVAKTKKRRRPSRKLKTDLAGLADVLPEVDDDDMNETGGPQGQGTDQAGRLRQRSLKSSKGALKKKERIVRGEMKRFGLNMAIMSAMQGSQKEDDTTSPASTKKTQGAQDQGSAGQAGGSEARTSDRWAALRGHIASTMEQNPAFRKS